VAEEELAAAGCAHAVRGAGAFGVGVGGSGGGGLLGCAVLSHRAAQLEEDQQGSMGWFGQHGFRTSANARAFLTHHLDVPLIVSSLRQDVFLHRDTEVPH